MEFVSNQWLLSGLQQQGTFLVIPKMVDRRAIELQSFLHDYGVVQEVAKQKTKKVMTKVAVQETKLNVQNVLSKVHVNQDVFNFFLKKIQKTT
jgi:hypothetical protein